MRPDKQLQCWGNVEGNLAYAAQRALHAATPSNDRAIVLFQYTVDQPINSLAKPAERYMALHLVVLTPGEQALVGRDEP